MTRNGNTRKNKMWPNANSIPSSFLGREENNGTNNEAD